MVFLDRNSAVAPEKKNQEYVGLGVKVRNMKMDFNTGGTWRRVRQ